MLLKKTQAWKRSTAAARNIMLWSNCRERLGQCDYLLWLRTVKAAHLWLLQAASSEARPARAAKTALPAPTTTCKQPTVLHIQTRLREDLIRMDLKSYITITHEGVIASNASWHKDYYQLSWSVCAFRGYADKICHLDPLTVGCGRSTCYVIHLISQR